MANLKIPTAILIASLASPTMAMTARVDEPAPDARPVIVKLQRTDAQGGPRAVVGNGQGMMDIMVQTGDPSDGEQRVIKLRATTKDIEPGGPWLGIQFGPVSKPVATHLGLNEGEGQMVLNVAEGSPADTAGLQQYDVIVNIDGQAVTSDLEAFMEIVRGFKPNEAHTFVIRRGAQASQVSIVVGARPENWADIEYKYETDMEAGPFQGRVMRRGGLLQKDDQGNWTFGALDDEDMLKDFYTLLPDPNGPGGWWSTVPPHGQNFQFFSKKGLNVKVERNDDGTITVTRTEMENGDEKTTTETFANEAEFKAKYPDGLVGDGTGNMIFQLNPFDPNDPNAPRAFKFKLGHTPDDLDIDVDLDVQVEKMLEEHQKLLDESEELLNGKTRMKVFKGPGAGAMAIAVERATTRFEINDDGSIRVTTRSGEDELVENYASGEALRQGRPDLFERYQKLMDVRQAEIDKAGTPKQ